MKKILLLLTATALTLTAQTFNVSTTAEFRTALSNAAGNGEDDTIILADGTYTTTDDSKGTFIYLDNEIYNLKLIGSGSKNVILSGDKQDQIFNHQSIAGANLKIEKITFLDGGADVEERTINGGGFEIVNAVVDILDCNFTNNHATSGGGFYTHYHYNDMNITNTSFVKNSAYGGEGGAFYSPDKVFITNSIFINNTAFTKDNNSRGGGFSITGGGSEVVIDNSTFLNNKTDGEGGGFYTSDTATITNSNFSENSAYQTSITSGGYTSYYGQGGGFYVFAGVTVKNTKFHKNIAGSTGGGFHNTGNPYIRNKIIQSTFTENTTLSPSYGDGAGFYSGMGVTIILNSIIKNNHSESYGGGMSVGNGFIVNSIISNNYAELKGGGINATRLHMSNSILAHNNSGISLMIGTIDDDKAIIINNIFLDVNDSIITPDEGHDPIVYMENNYINLDNISVRKFTSNNIFADVSLGFVDVVNSDYHLTANSDLIDAGTNKHTDKFIVDGVNYLAYDYEDNNRSVGANMDIGIYEYSTTKPTINSFTFSSDPKTLQEVTFYADYTLAAGRTISEVSFDYFNDDTFSTEETHIFTEAKTYKVTVKITDDTGEFSLRTIEVLVAALPYDEMTDAQRLINATDPLHYEDILSIIEQGKVDAEDAGKAYVQNNLPEFGLLTEADRDAAVTTATLEGVTTGREYVQDNLEEFGFIDKSTVEFTTASLATLPIGWSLVGISLDMTDLSVFDDATIVWSYDNSTSSWGAYASDAEMKRKITEMNGVNLLSTVPAGSGVWVQK